MKKHEETRNAWLVKTKHARPEIPGYDREKAKLQFPKTVSTWNGFLREEFTIGGRRAFIVFPDKPVAPGKEQLWIWRPQFSIISL